MPDYEKMYELLRKGTEHALRQLEEGNADGARIALLVGQSMSDMVCLESIFPYYRREEYDYDKLRNEDSDK